MYIEYVWIHSFTHSTQRKKKENQQSPAVHASMQMYTHTNYILVNI